MITIENAYSLSIYIKGTTYDIITQNGFKFINMIEQAGTELPTCTFSFVTTADDIVRYMNEKNILTIAMGRDPTKLFKSDWIIFEVVSKPISLDLTQLTVVLIKDVSIQWQEKDLNISDEMSSLDRLKELIKPTYKIDCDVQDEPDDKMYWIQQNTTLKKHIEDVWCHSDTKKSNDLLLLAPTLDTFKIRSFYKLASTNAKWKFKSNGEEGGNTYIFHKVSYINNQGDTNPIGARGIVMSQVELLNGEIQDIQAEPYCFLGIKEDILNDDIEPIRYPQQVLSRNQHPNYWQAYIRNTTNLLYNGSFVARCTFKSGLHEFELLDTVEFTQYEMRTGGDRLSEYYSNVGIITKISRYIAEESYVTTYDVSFASLKMEKYGG